MNGGHRSVRSRDEQKADPWSFKLLLWTAIAGLIFGLITFGEPLEDVLRTARNSVRWHKASGDIVLVKIDDAAIRDVGGWPWPRRRYAELTDALTDAGAKRIFFTLPLHGPTDAGDDRVFAESLERSGRVVLAVKPRSGPKNGTEQGALPYASFAQHAAIGSISAQYNYQNAIWRIPYAAPVGGKSIPSFATLLAGGKESARQPFMADYSIDPDSIPAVSAGAVANGRFNPELMRGKDVVIGATTDVIGDFNYLPGTGKMGGAYVHIIGAETLKAGNPRYFGWIPAFIAALSLSAFALSRRSARQQNMLLGGFVAALLAGPAALEANLIYVDITPALFVMLIIVAVLGWRHFRQRGLVNALSGLPNLSALRVNRPGRNQALIVARIMNYAEVVSALPSDSERQLVEQIVARLSLGSKDRTFFQGDGGIFAWFETGSKPFGHHIDALYALFRTPVRVGGLSVDLAISFGVEIGSSRSLANRLASAIVAAEDAAHDGLKWKYHDPQAFEDASWKLSMLSQLDSAIDKGEVWIAFQPQIDLKTRRIVGAEALARWTHPDKGPIAASEFVAAAEQHDRIGKLTDFVLEKAVVTAASINKQGFDFNVAVNLSARLLADKHFTMRVAALLARHGLEPGRLTLELTETTEFADGGEALDMLTRLRDLGIEISIDDYGTGLSTLDYLKKIPANEIKIDQSFVKGLCDNRSDRLMVQSTIGLAHSLERRVVAEGVEERDILDALTEMDCDLAQGFIIGRPMSVESLIKRISADRRRRVA
jgi:EAL domain-containing protein (putative c-di-GMP-specific phosphodiesterase class I)/CHASE2 domain-containing sensor protein